jgi:hypothetical protein
MIDHLGPLKKRLLHRKCSSAGRVRLPRQAESYASTKHCRLRSPLPKAWKHSKRTTRFGAGPHRSVPLPRTIPQALVTTSIPLHPSRQDSPVRRGHHLFRAARARAAPHARGRGRPRQAHRGRRAASPARHRGSPSARASSARLGARCATRSFDCATSRAPRSTTTGATMKTAVARDRRSARARRGNGPCGRVSRRVTRERAGRSAARGAPHQARASTESSASCEAA